MVNFKYIITDPIGIHARPAGKLVKIANEFKSLILVEKDGKKADARKLFALITLGVKQNHEVLVSAEGEDEESALSALKDFFKANL